MRVRQLGEERDLSAQDRKVQLPPDEFCEILGLEMSQYGLLEHKREKMSLLLARTYNFAHQRLWYKDELD